MQQNFDLKAFNTLAVSVRSRYFVDVQSVGGLQEALAFAEREQLPLLLLGGGSNLVLTRDFPGLTLHLNLRGVCFTPLDEHWIRAEARAGEPWHDFVSLCLDRGAFGLENLALIPGSVGAAPVQNIGAYGVEISDYLQQVTALDRHTGETLSLSPAQCDFGYRQSIFKGACRDRYIILSVSFLLRRQPRLEMGYGGLAEELAAIAEPTPRDLFDAVIRVRSAKLPDPESLPNAGSFFKNPLVSRDHYQRLKAQNPELVAYPQGPQVKLAAGWLIDRSGWKGYRDGPVGVHDCQALVLVNHGGGSGEQILALAQRIREDIRRRFAVDLEIEPRCY